MNVIKKLRRKFILISTATVTIIVIGALSLVTSVAYIRINAQIDSFLIYISQIMEEFLNINYHQILHGLVKRIGQEIHLIFPTSSAILVFL